MNLPGSTLDEVMGELTGEGDFIGFAMVKTIEMLEAEVHKSGWEQWPRLFMVTRHLASVDQLAELAEEGLDGVDGILLAVREMNSVRLMGDTSEELAKSLNWAARRPKIMEAAGEDSPVMGWILITEAYALLGDKDEIERAKRRGLVHHPDRVEIRHLLAVDRAGIAYQLMRARTTDERTLLRDESNGTDGTLAGPLTDALRSLTEATT